MSELFHTGYYLIPYWDIKGCLEAIPYEAIMGYKEYDAIFPYHNIEIFLNGSCQLFSYALYKAFGYTPYVIAGEHNFHCFCQTVYQGKRVYVDVRGMTSDFEEFLRTSCIFDDDKIEIKKQDISDKELFVAERDKEIGLPFAEEIIRRHITYYNR